MFNEGIYKDFSEEEILKRIRKKGFDPTKFSNQPKFVYERHKHPETKLLVFLDGEMAVKVGQERFLCKAGDELIIPGNTWHSAIVGKSGCTFFWSEKII